MWLDDELAFLRKGVQSMDIKAFSKHWFDVRITKKDGGGINFFVRLNPGDSNEAFIADSRWEDVIAVERMRDKTTLINGLRKLTKDYSMMEGLVCFNRR